MSSPTPRSLGRAGLAGVIIGWLALLVGTPFVTARRLDHAYGVVDEVDTLLLVLLIPALLALALVVVVIVVLGWWTAVLIEERGAPRETWWYGAVLVVAGVVATDWSQLADLGVGFAVLAALTALVLAAGLELLFRGLVICSLRRSGVAERAVATRSSALFAVGVAAMFLVESPLGVAELVAVAALGCPLYLLRRVSGHAVVPMLADALVLFGLASGGWNGERGLDVATTVALVLLIGVAVVAIARRGHLADQAPSVTVELSRRRTAIRWVGGSVAVVVAVALLATVVPVSSSNLGAQPDPTTTFEESLDRFSEATGDAGELGVIEPCRSTLLDHGEATAVAIVLFHGLTNCPEQFLELGRQLHDDGANVLIMRAPRHGLSDGTGQAIGSVDLVADLTAQELRDYGDESIDIATGLGDEVRVLGLSMGGVMAMWTAQFRDVERVVAVAPAVSIPGVPRFVTTAFINLFNRLPNLSLPTDGVKLDHTYAGESTGALSSMFLLARANENELRRHRSAAEHVVVVLNPDDDQVDFDHVRNLVDGWEDADGPVEVVVLPAIGLPHDVIDPAHPAGDIGLVYPILIDLLEADDSGG